MLWVIDSSEGEGEEEKFKIFILLLKLLMRKFSPNIILTISSNGFFMTIYNIPWQLY